jgi:ABC-type branched-subunit amino acid transport system ATPase component
MTVVPLATFMAFFLEERWNLGPGGRSLFSAAVPVFGITALVGFGRWGESLYRSDPARLIRTSAVLFAGGIVALPLAVAAPWFGLMFVLFGVSSALLAVLVPAFQMAVQGIIPARMRPHAAALSAIFLATVGGLGGLLLLGGIDRRYGTGVAIGALAVPGAIACWIVYTAARTINDDLDRTVGAVIEEEELRSLARSGQQLPMLACRNVDFFYGQLQVLFGVDFLVDEGEAVALLGTNGAGKSTLLRVISGLGLPARGSVRFRGADISYVDAERRVGLGISQVPGGRAIFGALSVVENLRAYAYMYGLDRARRDASIDAALEMFPALADRRNQTAATLSGGEQQMLALAKVAVIKPRLLLVDELSLGLAPKIVGELLAMVKRIHAEGTAIVLVEQSVNIALSVVDHAYFMEKGEIRFDGRAPDLLRRTDLLRSVFLEGASKGLVGAAKPRQKK